MSIESGDDMYAFGLGPQLAIGMVVEPNKVVSLVFPAPHIGIEDEVMTSFTKQDEVRELLSGWLSPVADTLWFRPDPMSVDQFASMTSYGPLVEDIERCLLFIDGSWRVFTPKSQD